MAKKSRPTGRPQTTKRVTPSKGSTPARATQEHPPSSPPTSGRYTPPAPKFRVRPRWHRIAGWAGVALGVLIAAVNDAMLIGVEASLLPGGHSELYLFLAVAVGGSSTWFLGVFDRGTTIFD